MRVAIFFAINIILASWHLFSGTNDNVTSRAAMVTAIVEQGTLRIDSYAEHAGDKALINGHYYSEKAPLPALLVVPFWWNVRALGSADSPMEGSLSPDLSRLGGLLVGSVPFALIVTLLWSRLRADRRVGGLPASWITMGACFGSFLFLQSGVFFGHLAGAAFLLLALLAWERGRAGWCGALAGCAVLCEYTNAVFPLFWAILLLVRRDFHSLGRFTLGGLPSLMVLALYNQAIAGTPFTIGYTHQVGYDYMHDAAGMGRPNILHLWHITFSDYRGLFFYTPVLAIAAAALFMRRGPAVRWSDPVLVPALITIILMSGFGGWWAGWSYGPRYLTAAAVLLLYRCLPAVYGSRWSVQACIPFALFGLMCAFAAKDTVGFSLPTEIMHPILEVVVPALGATHASDQWPVWLGVPAAWCSLCFLGLFGLGLGIGARLDRHLPQREE